MSDKSLRFLLFGEDRTAGKTFSKAAEDANTSGARIGGVFTKLGSAVGGDVGLMVDRIGQGFTAVGERGAKLGAKLMGIGGVIAGLGVFSEQYASKDQAAQNQLQAAVAATGKGYAGFKDDVERAIQTQEHYGHTADDTQTALRVMTQAFQDPKKALSEMTLVENIAAAKHISLADAATVVAKAHGGSTRIFREFGIIVVKNTGLIHDATTANKAYTTQQGNVDKAQTASEKAVLKLAAAQKSLAELEARDAVKRKLSVGDLQNLAHAHDKVRTAQDLVKSSASTLAAEHAFLAVKHREAAVATDKVKHATNVYDDALGTLGKRLTGQASAASDTFAGKLAFARAKVEDVGSAVAGKMGPALTIAGPIILGVGAVMESGLVPALGKGALGLAKMGARAVVWGAEMLAAGVEAMLPFLPIILIVAAVGVAAFLLWKNWDKVWGFIKSATAAGWNWIKEHFQYILLAFGPIGIALFFLKDHWSQIWSAITGALGAAWGFISSTFGNIVGFVTGLPGKISSAAAGMWDGIKGAFRGAIDWIIGAWNSLSFTLPSIDTHLPGIGKIGGFTIAVPKIPMLAAGTTDFAGGLAVVGDKGPELVHLPAHSKVDSAQQTAAMTSAGRPGPALVIEHYHEATADPHLIAAELAFHLRTA
jgi:hypothetical protein